MERYANFHWNRELQSLYIRRRQVEAAIRLMEEWVQLRKKRLRIFKNRSRQIGGSA